MTLPLNRARDVALHINSLLQQITVANGYETDIGIKVFRGKRKVDDRSVPCGVLLEGDDAPGGTQGDGGQVVTQSYVLGGYAPCDPDHPNDTAHKIISDLKKAVFQRVDLTKVESIQGTTTFGGRVKNVVYAGRNIGPMAESSAVVFGVIHIDVTFVERLHLA